jgi:trk system potassium uptake protein TrkA
MKAIIAGGTHEADYLVSLLKQEKYTIGVINNDRKWAKYISEKNAVDVYRGDPTKKFVQEEARVDTADIFIAVSNNDIDNYICCQIAQTIFGVKKVICTISNPKYAKVFDKLGIEGVVSSTQLLARQVFSEASYNKLSTTLSLEHDKLAITDVLVKPNTIVANKTLKEIQFPVKASVCAVFRDPDIIIPDGSTTLFIGDKVFIVSSNEDANEVVNFVNKEL